MSLPENVHRTKDDDAPAGEPRLSSPTTMICLPVKSENVQSARSTHQIVHAFQSQRLTICHI